MTFCLQILNQDVCLTCTSEADSLVCLNPCLLLVRFLQFAMVVLSTVWMLAEVLTMPF